MPKTAEGNIVRGQIIRSGTSSASNYRAACRGRSKAEFIAKMGIVEEELDKTMFWLEVVMESGMMDSERVMPLYNEANELISIIIKSKVTARKNKK